MLTAFLVEDSATIRDNLIPTLAELSDVQVVDVAETEDAAVEWIESRDCPSDIVILDLFLPQGSGLGVLSRLHALLNRCCVVVLTNYATTEIRRRCAVLGARAVFDKSDQLDAFFDFCRAPPQACLR